MQAPLANDTLLQNRFRLIRILGQGGCGLTYLALDEQRFEELCTIKEYFPRQGNTFALEKSRELFQREAKALYQLEHPQIPKFRALFEESERFFFAQDFVKGKPLNILWQERLQQDRVFTEREVVSFLKRLLPVLTYIHGLNLIHRDISLDNIILRDLDAMPVLIDFGVVKLAVDGSDSSDPNDLALGTLVGKSGYAPLEQLKTGRVYPNSDLYALAVTAIVLLTGKAPEIVFDEMTINWKWHEHAPNISQGLSDILDRMLSYQPQQRYQSAADVLAAITSMNSYGVHRKLALTTSIPLRQPNPTHKEKLSRRESTQPKNIQPPAKQNGINRVQSTEQSRNRLLSIPFWQWRLGLGLIIAICGLELLPVFKASSPSTAPRLAQIASPSISLLPISVNNAPIEVAGQVKASSLRRYAIEGGHDQELVIHIKSGNVRLHILHPDGLTPPGNPTISSVGNYFFPYSGKFFLDVKPTEVVKTTTNFRFTVELLPITSRHRTPSVQPPDISGSFPGRPPL